MRKLLILVLAFSVMASVAAFAQDMSQGGGTMKAADAPLKNIKGWVKADGDKLMAVLPADHRVDLAKFKKATGKRAALATETDFKELFPDCAVGTMPPFGGLYNVATFVDQSLTGDEFIVFEAGTHQDAIKMAYGDYVKLAKPTVAEFAVKMA